MSTSLNGRKFRVGRIAPIAFAFACPKVSLTCMNTAVRGAVLVAWNRSRISASPLRTRSTLVGKLRNTNLKPCSVICGAAAILITNGTPFCSHTCAMAREAPESKGPVNTCAPSLISLSARVLAVSTLVSVSAFINSMSTPSMSLRTIGARSAPF